MKSIRCIALSVILVVVAAAPSAFAKDGDAAALETIGATSGLLVYNTYIVIGSIADAYESDVYTADDVASYMDEQIASMQTMIEQFQTLSDSGFLSDPSDKSFADDLLATFRLLKDQANALKDYAVSKSESDANAFQDRRHAAWEKISKLLDIE